MVAFIGQGKYPLDAYSSAPLPFGLCLDFATKITPYISDICWSAVVFVCGGICSMLDQRFEFQARNFSVFRNEGFHNKVGHLGDLAYVLHGDLAY